jgi:hypothetical protein
MQFREKYLMVDAVKAFGNVSVQYIFGFLRDYRMNSFYCIMG